MKNEDLRPESGQGFEAVEQVWEEAVAQELEAVPEPVRLREDGQTPAPQKKPAFVIDDDSKADWAVRKIWEEKQEYDRIRELGESQISRIEEQIETARKRFDHATAYLRSLLGSYFMAVPHKKTKTQETYRLLSGKLVLKHPAPKVVYEESELLQYLKSSGLEAYIETKEKPRWGEFKRTLDLTAGEHPVVMDTGEVVECVRLEELPAEFKVEV